MTTRSEGLIVLNQMAGPVPVAAAVIEPMLAGRNFEILTLRPGLDLAAIIRDRLFRGIRHIVAAGGDGTIHHVAQAVVGTDAVLSILPIGTYNHFARDLGIPLGLRDAVGVMLKGQTIQVDTGRVNHIHFVNNLSLGLYPEIVRLREKMGRRKRSRWRSVLYAVYSVMRSYPHVALTIDSAHLLEAVKTHLFMVSNNPYDLSGPGIEAARTSIQQGLLSVYWLPHRPRLAFVRSIARYIRGRSNELGELRSTRTQHLRINSPRHHLHVAVDGEVFELEPPLVIDAVPLSLEVKVP
ncbi:MAG: diacylglycerol kinase family protein [Thermoanaerobaculia bacterium]